MPEKASGERHLKFWLELQPIVNHVISVLVIELGLLAIGLVTHWLQAILPAQAKLFNLVETVDAWTALIVLCLFAFYTILQVALRLIRSLLDEWHRAPKTLKEAQTNE